MKVLKWIDKNFEEYVIIVLLLAISFVMLVQIFCRYVINSSLVWAEEFCRYCYVWMVALSLSFTMQRDNMLRMSVVVDLFPQKIRKTISILVDVLLMVTFAYFFIHAIEVTQGIFERNQTSTAMKIPMWTMYISFAIGFGLATIRALQVIIRKIRHFGDKEATQLEKTIQEAEEEVRLAQADNAKFGGVDEAVTGGEQ